MAMITLLGRDFDVAPYKIGTLRQAAPIIDRINANITDTSLTALTNSAGDLCAFLAIGIGKLDPSVTAATLEDELGIDDLPTLRAAFLTILAASGFEMREGNVPAASDASDPAASPTPSTAS